MAFDFQVTLDCREPHVLAEWWADALGWNVEPQDPAFIREMVDKGFASLDDTVTYKGALVWKEGAAIVKPGDAASGPPRRFLFQAVPEPKITKNRMHLDLRVGAANMAAEVARLSAMGGVVLHTGQQGPHTWTTMADPEGNEFCVA
jgi:hypothetical protein